MTSKSYSRRIAMLGMLCAQAIVLTWIEHTIPPFPFLPPGGKAGFSNIITMYTAGSFGVGSALIIAVVKSLFVLLTRGVTAFLISLGGGIASTLIMGVALHRKSPFGYIGIGVTGALAHQLAQFAIACFLIGPAMVYYLPYMIVVGIIAGCITGTILHMILPALHKLSRLNK